jgi:hypothetical protein
MKTTELVTIDLTQLASTAGGGGAACAANVAARGLVWGTVGATGGMLFSPAGLSAGFLLGFAAGAGKALITSPACFGRSRWD